MRFTVYVHTNKVNGKKYVGATTLDVKRRWRDGRGYTEKHQPIFHAAIEKYGWDGFWHEVIGVASKEDMYALEQQLIALYNTTDPMFGYNSQTGGDSGFKLSDETRRKMSEALSGRCGELSPMYGKRHTDESRRKMSEAKSGELNPRYGKSLSEETRKKMSIPICQYSKDGVFIREWCSGAEASETLGINRENITHCCRGRIRSAGGYIWRYKI